MFAPGRNDALFARIIRAGRWIEILGVLTGVIATLAVEERLKYPALQQMEEEFHILPNRGHIIVVICAVMIAFNALAEARRWEPLITRASIRGIAIDLAFITAIVSLSDGVQSLFFGLYFFAIIGAAIWFGVRGALSVAGISTLCIFLIEAGEFIDSPSHTLVGFYAKFGAPDIFARLPYLFLVAWLTGEVTDAFRREVERRLVLERTSTRLEAEQERIEREMQAARQVQQTLLPSTTPDLPGLRVAARYQPAGPVGGDIYDFIRHSSSEVGFVIADVSGHSLPAALLVAAAKGALYDALTLPPSEMMAAVNRRIHRDTGQDRFVTMVYARVDTARGRLLWTNAGHPPPILYHQHDPAEVLEGNGIVLGVVPGATFETRDHELTPGDFLVLYSDGLVERHNETGKTTGLSEFLEVMTAVPAGEDPEAMADAILERASVLGEARDDVALLVVKWEESLAPPHRAP